MNRRTRATVLAVAAAVLGGGCGQPAKPPAKAVVPTTSTSSTTTTPPPSTAVVAGSDASADTSDAPATDSTDDGAGDVGNVATGVWEDVTSNLAGLESSCGNLAFVTVDPRDDRVIAGVALQGLWALDPGTDEWLQLGQGRGSDLIINRASSIAFDPDDPERFWQSGTYAFGAFETRDGGATFQQLGDVEHLDHISVDFDDPERRTLLSGGHERSALYLSTDGGASWTDIAGSLPDGVGFTSYPVVLDASTFLLGTNNGERSGIFRSDDAGQSWEMVYDQPVTGAPVIDGDAISWLIAGGFGLVASDDGGASFEPVGSLRGGGQSSLIELPDGRLATLGPDRVVVTDDGGASWSEVGPELPYVPWGLAYAPDASAFYIWVFTCTFDDGGNPVLENSIMRLDVDWG